MSIIDDINELRAELKDAILTRNERREAEARLAALLAEQAKEAQFPLAPPRR